MSSAAAPSSKTNWLIENGPDELERLFRAIVFNPAAPILITDDERNSKEASVGAAKLLGIPRKSVIGRQLDEFADPNLKPEVSQLWQAFLQKGEQKGTLQLIRPDGVLHEVEYVAKGKILPVRHVLVLKDKTAATEATTPIPAWVQDYALFLVDTDGRVAAWYSGAERIYGYPAEEGLEMALSDELQRTSTQGHFGTEGWCVKKDGTRFWANAITTALRDANGHLQGFGRVVRDFTDRHERDERLRRKRARVRPIPTESTIAGVASGEYDASPEINDTLLELLGYTREDLAAGLLNWADLTPKEYAPLDELAHEEGLRFGACSPFEKEFLRKDGTRVPVLVATAVLQLSPFRWITFVQDLRDRNRFETIENAEIELKQDFEEIVGTSDGLRRVQQQIEVVAPTGATVLILGETGTGKELIARAIHRISPRRNLPFITLNCAAIPTGLLESELFGYERGAFTGALQQKIGRFEMAHRGTLFLDEVGDIPLDLQPKLLRALQEKAFERLGGTKTIPIDVRLVAATNRNLTQMMGDKLFRSDLYYRLKVFPITSPPLRDRPDDIPILARHFTKKYSAIMERDIDTIPSEIMKALVKWSWPGNVRELENFIERSVILSRGPMLRAPIAEIREEEIEPLGSETLEQVEREHIVKVLRECEGVVTTAATRLGLHRTTLNAMMRKLGISRKDI